MVVDMAIIDGVSSLLAFDCSETARRVRSVSDAQKLIDIVDLTINNRSFLRECGPEAVCKAAHLASEIFARVPLLPESLFLNRPISNGRWATTSVLEVSLCLLCAVWLW
ncbi:hypothetical protein M378DRAFT_319441 [Amanita muscaria Koide BX008]|uniref:Uncharacterized protein n=1 Tax=Amanita muscaria (strain Koide BX008) TaxID=946122 RepID=A0A0C2S6I0_AMAMK|nr:hypothetical protein M378DRAFT_319441 [Amanita muscaria Koide BX008]